MNTSTLELKSKKKLYKYVQLIKLSLGFIVFVFSFTFLSLGKFDFYVPYLAAAVCLSGLLGFFLMNKYDQQFSWSPKIITALDIYSFWAGIYISQFTYNTLIYYVGGFLVVSYFFTNKKIAFGHLVTSLIFGFIWIQTDLFPEKVLMTDGTYGEPFFLSTSINLLFIFSLFHFAEKIKNEYSQELINATEKIEDINSFPLKNPDPVCEFTENQDLIPKNRGAREFILSSTSEQIEEVLKFAIGVQKNQQDDKVVMTLGENVYMLNANSIKNKVNLYFTDVSELYKVKKEFEAKELQNRAIIDAIPGFVSCIDKDLNYLGVNDHMCEFFGKSQDQFVGHKIGTVSSKHNTLIAQLVVDLFQSDDNIKQKEFSFQHGEKEFWSYITLKKYNNNKNAVLISIDVTKLKDAERLIRDEQSKSEASARLASVGEMAAGIAHEINNPLAVLNSISYTMKKLKDIDKLTDDKFEDMIGKMSDGISRITKIITGMKNLSREGGGDPFESASMKEIVDDSLVLLAKKCLHSGIDLQVSNVESDWHLDCQRVQISQSLVILINNAIDAIENLPEKWIKLDIINQPDAIGISITDSGAGIPPEIAKKIFQPFYTTKAVGKGTGLGLSVAFKIIKLHGGKFSLDSNSPNTKFDIIIPKNSIKSAA